MANFLCVKKKTRILLDSSNCYIFCYEWYESSRTPIYYDDADIPMYRFNSSTNSQWEPRIGFRSLLYVLVVQRQTIENGDGLH